MTTVGRRQAEDGALDISISPMVDDEREVVADITSRAFLPTPVVSVVMGRKREGDGERLAHLFGMMVRTMEGRFIVARVDGRVVGMMRYVEWPGCHFKPSSALRSLPSMLWTMGWGRMSRFMKFRRTWEEHDPERPHIHLDPLVVHPDFQGRGVGSALLGHLVEQMDARNIAGYLETDRDANVRLYSRFGFKVIGGVPIFGTPTHFMWRDPRVEHGDQA